MIIAAALVRLRVMRRIWLAATPVAGAHYFTGVARALAWAIPIRATLEPV